ncbi:MAG: hypothetical protein K2O73_01780 [Lachnospiraceae bacterium]|nr:hypothetical protein [Lachnospiraceae bacterium]
MNRTRRYTLISLLAAFVFIFGSMAGMSMILKARERQLLTQSGTIVVESPVQAWEGLENTGEEETGTAGSYTLTESQIENAIINWAARSSLSLHDPVEGQLSMEDAIQCGKDWLGKMGFGRRDREDPWAIRATLGVPVSGWVSQEQLAPYHSFWMIRVSSKTMEAELVMNAVTGQVWEAIVKQYDGMPEKLPGEALPLFMELAGVEINAADSEIVTSDGARAYVKVEDTRLYGVVEMGRTQTDIAVVSEAGSRDVRPYTEGTIDVTVTTLYIDVDQL